MRRVVGARHVAAARWSSACVASPPRVMSPSCAASLARVLRRVAAARHVVVARHVAAARHVAVVRRVAAARHVAAMRHVTRASPPRVVARRVVTFRRLAPVVDHSRRRGRCVAPANGGA
ncbi:MAG TPA: hypothetical protein VNS09_05580 [Solirubrobacter sp.]|nr:hypothetical protein [Solirubrobacter sp.]